MIETHINIFKNELRVPYIEIVKGTEGYGINNKAENYEVEAAPYTRVYTYKDNREFIFKLSMYARDMIMAIQYFINPNYEYVILSYNKMVELYQGVKYVQRRYNDTVKELISYGIIACKSKSDNSFWYNPILFAGGNRLDMYPECKVKVKTIYKKNN